MSTPTTTLAMLTNRRRSDTVRVKVVDKQPKQQSASKVSYQRMVFSDREGTKLTCTLFGVDIDIYDGVLTRGKLYDIKNMIVKEVPPRFASYEGEKQLCFTNSTSVLSVVDAGSSSKPVSPFTMIGEISPDASTDDRFDMVLLVLHINAEKMVPKGSSLLPVREMFVTDSRKMIEFFNLIETVVDEDPVVEFIGLKLSRYVGFSLATSLSTQVKLHPTSEEATAMRKWAKANPEIVHSRTLRSLHYEYPGYPKDVTVVVAVLSKEPDNVAEADLLRIRVHIPEIRYDDVRLSVGCRACGKACIGDGVSLSEDYHCEFCSATTKPEANFYYKCGKATENYK